MTRTINDILDERNLTHGNYILQSEIANDIDRAIFKHGPNLTQPQIHSLHMIAIKISRIATGDPDFADHWRDIAGYAMLIVNILEPKS